MRTSAGSTFLAEGTACAKPLTQENAWVGRAARWLVWLRQRREKRQGKLRSEEKEKGLGLSPVCDGGHGNFVLRSDLTFTQVTLAAGLETDCKGSM